MGVKRKNGKHAGKYSRRDYSVLSAFTGLGGLDFGLQCAGFSTLTCIERDEFARRSIEANGLWPLHEVGDIMDAAPLLSPAKLGLRVGELSLLAAAPPCQPFSVAAQWSQASRAGLGDKRAACVDALFELISKFQPKVILLENVVGFVQGGTSALPYLESKFREINKNTGHSYSISWAVLDAAHFGVPQHRRRAIIVVARSGATFKFPRATHLDRPIRAFVAIGTLKTKAIPAPRGKWASLLPTIPEGWNYLYHTPGNPGRPLFGERTRFWSFLLKLAKDRPSWTLSAQPGPATGPFHWSGRPLATEELLRLQSFPAKWRVAGTQIERVRQIGNATPPLIAEVLGREILRQLLDCEIKGKPSLLISRKRNIPKPSPVEKVPRRFRVFEGAHKPHAGSGRGPNPRNETTGQS
jgi:DNA (cytosine-5)-methyltransferase 1